MVASQLMKEATIMHLTGESARIHDELKRAYNRDCWHGPPLREVLEGVPATVAAAKHPQLAHSIWELVRHVSAWVEVVSLRITEGRPVTTPDEGDFPPVTDTGEAAWAEALHELDARHNKLLGVVARLDDTRLDETVPGKEYPVAVMLHGSAQHYAYHAGQIAILKKLIAG
jgi:hypothetical protein